MKLYDTIKLGSTSVLLNDRELCEKYKLNLTFPTLPFLPKSDSNKTMSSQFTTQNRH